MLRGACVHLRRHARAARGELRSAPARTRGLATRPRARGLATKKRDPAVAHAQREAVRQNWNPFAFDGLHLNSPVLWGAVAVVAVVATAWDDAETDRQKRKREDAERRDAVARSLAALRSKT